MKKLKRSVENVHSDPIASSMKPINNITLRKWRTLNWRDPRTDLVQLGKLQARITQEGNPSTLEDLRNHDLEKYLEFRQAALFAYFIGHSVLRTPIAYAVYEAEDYDCVLWWKCNRGNRYTPVQLKEVVPTRVNPHSTVNSELSKLRKYAASSDTVAAFHVNQSGQLDFSKLQTPNTGCREIWLYTSISADQSKWLLYGDLLHNPRDYEIDFPT